MHAYDEDYLPDAKNHLGIMLDYAVNTCHMDIRDIFMRFAYGTVGPAFAMGHPMFVAGMSGGDLARRVLEGTGWARPTPPYQFNGYSPEYWAGWALAHFQWYCGLDFAEIDRRGLHIEDVLGMYHPLHEADIRKFLDFASRKIHPAENPLKALRKAAGLTQAGLAQKAEVPLRLIRAYEQGALFLSRAETATVMRLARALECEVRRLVAD